MSDINYDSLVKDGVMSLPSEKNSDDFYITLNYGNFWGARVAILVNEINQQEEYICIPIKRNGFTKVEHGVYVTLSANRFSVNHPKGTHCVSLVMSSDLWRYRNKMGVQDNSIGRMRPYGFVVKKYNKKRNG